MLGLFLFATISFLTKCDKSTEPFEFTGVEIPTCTEDPSNPDQVSEDIHCTDNGKKVLKLSTSSTDITINSVTYTAKDKVLVTSLCKKIGSSDDAKYEIDIKGEVKNIIYTKGNKVMAILAKSTNKCFEDILLKDEDIKTGYVQVETIACYPTDKVSILTKKNGNSPIEFPIKSPNTCFLAPMLVKPVEVEFEINKSKFKTILSAYPKKQCEPCPNLTQSSGPEPTPGNTKK